VGATCYQRAGDAGYFHFWIGADHQNRGLGRRAGQLLQRQARGAGLTCLYTSAYADNPRSLAALDALGFEQLAVRAVAPDDDLLFLAAPMRAGHTPCIADLARLCHAIDSPLVFEVLPVTPDRALAH
jgi:GNAT superfamily N-acetyltransferase